MCHLSNTMYARRHIINNRSLTHVFFRCHNRQFFLQDCRVKNFLLQLWAKYKTKHQIKILDFIIMDNHAHLLLYVKDVELLGHFMRTVNSQLARFINKLLDRDSQAIRERYKSPLITNGVYLRGVMQYIWLNRYKVNKQNPSTDPYCSASWRINPEIVATITKDSKKIKLLETLLDSYEGFVDYKSVSIARFVRDLLNEAISKLQFLTAEIFENSHTIGDEFDVTFRGELLSSFHRVHDPGPPYLQHQER
jgi:REP element-mobilizing transposase RayT